MISKRLSAIVNLIKNDNNIADIGSDHGYVLLELRKKGFVSRLMGVENKKNPFLHLKENVARSGYQNIECVYSDGLNDVDNEFKTIVIAGMGFDIIKNIILSNKEKLKYINNIIIDSHTDKSKVRPFFISLGYDIDDEVVIFEDDIYYDLVSFKKCNNIQKYTMEELEFGKINLLNKSNDFKNMIIDEINKNISIIQKINDPSSLRVGELNKRNDYLRGIIKWKLKHC